MGTRDPRIDKYIENAAEFAQPILAHLREVVHAGCPDVEEGMKWSFPHFMHHGVMCSMASFKAHCAFGFWKASLVLDAPTEEDAAGSFGRITSIKDLPSKRELIAYVKKAAALNEAGVKVEKAPKAKLPRPLDIPADLTKALKGNRKARDTFDAFSTSHKREYVEWITEAKREETRAKRLEQTIAMLAEGKSRHHKYQGA
jgi:uncharacterized protein YdeI (YjbR/CyaY-like superfamily)